MKEKVRKSSLKYAFLFLVSIFIFHTDVLAYEMELGQRTEKETEEDIAYFDVHVSKVWTSKGKELLSYDVSESGKILISFPEYRQPPKATSLSHHFSGQICIYSISAVQISPLTAEAATVAADPKYTFEEGCPALPLKFLVPVLIKTSFSPITP